MPTCDKCHHRWSWKQTLKKTTTLNPEMLCPYCGKKQYQTQKSKTKISLLTPIVLMPLLIRIFIDVPEVYLVSLFIILALSTFLVYPFLVEISSEEEYINFFENQQ